MNNKVAIIQSNYIPWKGYFDIIARSDLFVILDTVQSTKNDWRNRNQIKTSSGLKWLTIPTHHSLNRRICEVEIASDRWSKKHLQTISQNYSKSRFFDEYRESLVTIYEACQQLTYLSEVNRVLLEWTCNSLGITTPIVMAEELVSAADLDEQSPSARLVTICNASNSNIYLSGPSAKGYIDPLLFRDAEIDLEYMCYEGYQTYPQLHGEFVHNVSALDVLFNCGPAALKFITQASPSLEDNGNHNNLAGTTA